MTTIIATEHWSDPARGTQEYLINQGLERSGISQRVCLHADRTITHRPDDAPAWVSCDYCDTGAVMVPGLRTDLAATYWRAS